MTKDQLLFELIASLELRSIVPMKLESERFSDPPAVNSELQLASNVQFSDNDPEVQTGDNWVFRPRMICEVSLAGAIHFRQTTYFVLLFGMKNMERVQELWTDLQLRKDFQEKQVTKTLWPLFRQHVIDGMSRVGLPFVTLPWLV